MRLILLSFICVLLVFEHQESNCYERHNSCQKSLSVSETSDQTTRYRVVGIKDGDTFVLLIDNKEKTVRFAHIDCPEKRQPFGNQAKQFVSDMCFETYVTLKINPKNKQDRNGRLIAEVILEDGRNLNKELVKNGLAWHFKKYSNDYEYARLENEARNNKIGLWEDPSPISPWDWRKPKK